MDHGPEQPIPGAPVPQAADQARSGPQLAHSHRERSAEPLPDTLMVLIPPQPEPLWPFLVCGAVGKKILGNHFSLVRRRDDETVDDTVAVVHGLMVAGRAALSGAPRQALIPRQTQTPANDP